ncbi:MAG: type IV pilus modification PilV family protein [Bradyrhizobium sp.]
MFHVTRIRRTREGGFTLIEALVALAVMTAVLASIGSLIAVARTGTRTLEQRVALSEALRLVSATAPRVEQWASPEQSGYIPGGFTWRLAALPFEQDAVAVPSNWIPVRVVIQVRAPSGAVSSVETIQVVKRPER